MLMAKPIPQLKAATIKLEDGTVIRISELDNKEYLRALTLGLEIMHRSGELSKQKH